MAFVNFISEGKTTFQDMKQCLTNKNLFNIEFGPENIQLKRSLIWK